MPPYPSYPLSSDRFLVRFDFRCCMDVSMPIREAVEAFQASNMPLPKVRIRICHAPSSCASPSRHLLVFATPPDSQVRCMLVDSRAVLKS